MELRREHDDLSKEKDMLEKLLGSEKKQWNEIARQIGETKKLYAANTTLGARRTTIGKVPTPMAVDLNIALIEKEPITVVCSSKGWIRTVKGHDLNHAEFKYKEGDREQFVIEGQTTDKFIAYASNGRFYTLAPEKLPAGRGFGDPVRLIVDIPNDADIISLFVHKPDEKFLLIARDGRGFIVPSNDLLAQTKNGKQIMSVEDNGDAVYCAPVEADHNHIAIVAKGTRKMLVFKLDQIPEMAKGKGVMLQKYKDAEFGDAKTFNLKAGLTYRSGTKEVAVPNVKEWVGERAAVGKLPPNGFPKSGKF
jgi:topoisomerase-4 subunit A